MWAKTETISGSGKRAPNSGVPLRSQNRALHVEQYSMLRCLLGPYRSQTDKLPDPRLP
jgi:hypothetical protein